MTIDNKGRPFDQWILDLIDRTTQKDTWIDRSMKARKRQVKSIARNLRDPSTNRVSTRGS